MTEGDTSRGSSTAMDEMREYRLRRIQEQLVEADCAAALLLNPINASYATGISTTPIFNLHTPGRTAIVPATGKVTMVHLEKEPWRFPPLTTVKEYVTSPPFNYFMAGVNASRNADTWARLVADVVSESPGKRVALDMVEPLGYKALAATGLEVISADTLIKKAGRIKCKGEIACLERAVQVAEIGMSRMREALRPGMTENELLSLLHAANIEHGGHWLEYHFLVAGERTNPWGRESTDNRIDEGELVGFDCGMIGPELYSADVSRTLLCGDAPTAEQRRLYSTALENLRYNTELIKPGVSFRDLAEREWRLPNEFVAHRYGVIAHGIGMGDEWPEIRHLDDWNDDTEDGVLEEGMAICVESFVGSDRGGEGVKLEDQVVVTSTGHTNLTTFPFEAALAY
jgi:Xaa-Pro aminopeptidase